MVEHLTPNIKMICINSSVEALIVIVQILFIQLMNVCYYFSHINQHITTRYLCKFAEMSMLSIHVQDSVSSGYKTFYY